MVGSDSESDDADGIVRGVNRRTVLQGLGTGAAAGVGLVGTASGHQVQGKPVFCGCSQLCVCVDGNSDVLMAQENDDGSFDVGFVVGDGELDPSPEGEPRYSGNFCVSTDDEDVPDGRLIGLQVDGTRWVNPNQCAQKALEAEREQLDSTHSRPESDSGESCQKPPCEHPGNGNGADDGDGDDGDDAGEIEVTWEDCETVRVTGSNEGLDKIIVHPIRCFPDDGPCPDGVPGGRTIEDPELPLTIDDQYLAVDGDDVPYYIAAIELQGDVEQDSFGKPDDLDCDFDSSAEIEVTWEDCETVTLTGPDDNLERIDLYLMRCFDDGPCPDGQIVTREAPTLPLTLGRDELAGDDTEYRIDAVDLFGDVTPDDATPPDDLDCSFESPNTEVDIAFEMDHRTVTLAADADAASEATITGTAEFSYAGWEEAGPVGHAFITSWAQSDADIDFPDRDIQRYFDVDGDTDTVTKDIDITFDVPPAVGDPESGEAIETEILGVGFFGLERGTDPEESESIGDWRENDPLTLRVERA
jgi:hypothetical protein